MLEKSQVNNLTLYLKELEKEEKIKPKVSRTKEIVSIRMQINEIETRKTIERIKETTKCFFKKINNIDKPLVRLRKKKKSQIKLEMKREDITTDTTEMHRIIRDYYEQLYANGLYNLKEMDTFLETHNLP